MSVEVLTFGCRLNGVESEAIRERAAAAGRDLVVVNTCAVTAEATRQARQAIRRAARRMPGALVVATGCAAQVEPASFAAMPEVGAVLGNEEKLSADAWGRLAPGTVAVGDIMAAEKATSSESAALPMVRAFVPVQNGCDHRCTFCIIPLGRGRSRSVPAAEVIRVARDKLARGAREIVLTGVDITSWGVDLGHDERLGDLVRAILQALPDLPRLRLSSVDSIETDPALLAALAEEERFMPHLHLSLQAGDDLVLKRMKRRHSRADAIRFCRDVRALRPDVVFGADLIAGFPTETVDGAARSLDLVAECGLTWLHVFPYSPRPGTPAARMPAVPGPLIRERAARLREAGEGAVRRHLASWLGRAGRVLVETERLGRMPDFTPVRFAADRRRGETVRLSPAGIGAGELLM